MITNGNTSHITLLDGGMGRELLRMGAPFQQPEWSALSLMKAPDLVKKAHTSFAEAGSDILTTNNYAVVPFHIGEQRFALEGAKLTGLAGQLARDAALPYDCKVAGSIPPLFGSYRPDLYIPEKAQAILKVIIEALSPNVDLWLAETISSIGEAMAIAEALSGDERPLWISFTLLEGDDSIEQSPRLRSHQKVTTAISAAVESGASAILFNCCQPEAMASAIKASSYELNRLGVDLPIGVYANAFPVIGEDVLANSSLCEIRQDLDPQGYLEFVESWCRLGASIIGGCCGIGPEHIAALHERLKE